MTHKGKHGSKICEQCTAVASGGPVVPGPPFKLCAAHFMFGPPTYHEAVELLCAVVDSQ